MIQQRDFEELYQLLKGSPVANLIVDAQSAFQQKDFRLAREHVDAAQALYEQRQQKKERRDKEREQGRGKPSARRAKLIAEKQEKKSQTFSELKRLLHELDRLIAANQSKEAAAEAEPEEQAFDESRALEWVSDESLLELRDPLKSTTLAHEQLEILASRFDLIRVESYDEFTSGAVLHIETKSGSFLVRCFTREEDATLVDLRLAMDGKPLRPQKKQQLLQESRKGRLVLIAAQGTTQRRADPATGEPTESDVAAGEDENSVDSVLDMGAFTQLHDAAQRCGLVPSADLIAHVRDREFRMGDYPKAFQVIEGLFGKFSAAASHREQRLRREDVDIASGRIKISPKELQAKRARDTADNQRIGRARSRFSRVMEGLRVILLNEQKQRDAEAQQEREASQ